jgi:hypothetical protein
MKYLDFPSLLDSEPANLALLSTFNFDPDYFERILLRCRALSKARRIAIFMDAGQWMQLRLQDTPARWLNRRYLVVPVRYSSGVFHPKLDLLIHDDSGQVLCGSNNLTRAGCSHNLELVNSIRFHCGNGHGAEHVALGKSAFRFFEMLIEHSQGEASAVVESWLKEEKRFLGWTEETAASHQNGESLQLLHTLDGSLWDQLQKTIAGAPLKRMLVISPFYDADGEMLKRVRSTWPKCRLEVIAQQHTSDLPVAAIEKAHIPIELREVGCRPRRLHAKLLAWDTEGTGGCFVGSANFTSAAWDGRNIEACLFIPNPKKLTEALFDSTLHTRSMHVGDFVAGNEREPQLGDDESALLSLRSAVLIGAHSLQFSYRCSAALGAIALSITIRAGGEPRPRAAIGVPIVEDGSHVLQIEQQVLAEIRGSILISLLAQTPDGERESLPLWLIQEDRLTYEPSVGDSANNQSSIVEDGFLLPEYLEELGKREGASALVEFLGHLNLHFHDGAKGSANRRKFRLRRSDPFHPDVLPEWWHSALFAPSDLRKAIGQFVRRHEDRRLKKHAKRGNINGMENFLDIFVAIVRLLYVYRKRTVVERDTLIHHISRCLLIATTGIKEIKDGSKGYLLTLSHNLQGNRKVLQHFAGELNFGGYLDAALLIAQMEKAPTCKHEQPASEWVAVDGAAKEEKKRIRSLLPQLRTQLDKGLLAAGIRRATPKRIMSALESFEMMSKDDLATYRSTLAIHMH